METQITKIPRIPIKKAAFRLLPQEPGVYIFWKKKAAIYIGKAVDLKARLSSYLAVSLSPKTKKMLEEAESVSIIKVRTELESLLLEAYLVHKNQPRYNFALKDDKHPLYIKITKEKYPRVITARKIEEKDANLAFYGPFSSSESVRGVLKMLRRVFPYSDHKLGKRGCIYSQIGLCNPCPNEIEKEKNLHLRNSLRRQYLRNINYIKGVLAGNIEKVKNELTKTMNRLAKEEKFEEAKIILEQITRLNYITQPRIPTNYFLENPNFIEDIHKIETHSLRKILLNWLNIGQKLSRIECFDVAHLAGSFPTASMVTFINGEPEKSYYRHFKIRQTKTNSDIDSIGEVAKRRIKYLSDWGKPDLIIVDGGAAQVGAFTEVFKNEKIPVLGLAKRLETLVIPSDKLKTKYVQVRIHGPALNLLQRLRDEAHRFARRYHHSLIRKSLLYSN